MKLRYALPLVAAALLAGCGHVSDNITFQAPANFHSKASLGPFMQVWESTPDSGIVLIALPVATDLNTSMSQANLKDAKVEKRSDISICHGQKAVYMELQGESNAGGQKSSHPSEIQFVATNAPGKTVMAMYMRPLHTPPDPAAATAIKNLCPK
jgi:hypothetical protein